MPKRGKFFELLDIPKFARPDIRHISPAQTAAEVFERLSGGGFMSYGQIWPRLPLAVKGLWTDEMIERSFSPYKDDWKNDSIKETVRLLRQLLGGKGNWYPAAGKPKYVQGVWFKPSIKGYWFFEGQAYAVLINARKGQPLSTEDASFLARGVYELHCIDDPNDPIPFIVDTSEVVEGQGRKLRTFAFEPSESMPVSAFEQALKEFLEALHIAGIALPVVPEQRVMDLFRRP